jgi:hypothetical protein
MKRISRLSSEKFSNKKFHENPSSGSQFVRCGRTDGQITKQIVAFRNFANAPKNVANTQDKSYFCTKIVLCRRLFYFAFTYRTMVSLLSCVCTENVTECPTDAGFLCNKPAIINGTIKWTLSVLKWDCLISMNTLYKMHAFDVIQNTVTCLNSGSSFGGCRCMPQTSIMLDINDFGYLRLK